MAYSFQQIGNITYNNATDNDKFVSIICYGSKSCRTNICNVLVANETINISYDPIFRDTCPKLNNHKLNNHKLNSHEFSKKNDNSWYVRIPYYINGTFAGIVDTYSEYDCYIKSCKILSNENVSELLYLPIYSNQKDCENI